MFWQWVRNIVSLVMFPTFEHVLCKKECLKIWIVIILFWWDEEKGRECSSLWVWGISQRMLVFLPAFAKREVKASIEYFKLNYWVYSI